MTSPQRKPANSAEPRKDLCFCNHGNHEHSGGPCYNCDCLRYRPRPMNRGLPDRTPEHLLRMGIKASEWQFVTVPQLRALMGSDFSTAARVYACGLTHSVGQTNKRLERKGYSDKFASKHPDRAKTWMTPNRGRLAIRIAQGKAVPLRPIDIVRELNDLDPAKTLAPAAVRKTLRELERQGLCRAGGRPVHGERRLFFYARPLASGRTGTTGPESIEPLIDGVKFDPIEPVSPSDQQTYAILSFQKVFVKRSLNLCRRIFGDGVNLDPIQPEIDRLFDEVKNALIRLADGVKNGAAYKEDSSISSEPPSSERSSDFKEREACLPASPVQAAGRPLSLVDEKTENLRKSLLKRMGKILPNTVPGDPCLQETLSALGDLGIEHLEAVIDAKIAAGAEIRSYGLIPKLARDAAKLASMPKTESGQKATKPDRNADLFAQARALDKRLKSPRQEYDEEQERRQRARAAGV